MLRQNSALVFTAARAAALSGDESQWCPVASEDAVQVQVQVQVRSAEQSSAVGFD